MLPMSSNCDLRGIVQLPVWHKLTTELAGEAGVAQVNLEKQTGLQWRFRRQVRPQSKSGACV